MSKEVLFYIKKNAVDDGTGIALFEPHVLLLADLVHRLQGGFVPFGKVCHARRQNLAQRPAVGLLLDSRRPQ